jgi:hypothetical protein
VTTTLSSTGGGTATRAEFFSVPGDYRQVETEDGTCLADGTYWWFLREDGCPDSYASGPFDTMAEAFADWQAAGSHEPEEEE